MIKIELNYIVTKNEDQMTIANILRRKVNVSSRLLTKLKMDQKILVNNEPVFSNYIVRENDKIVVKIDFEETDGILPEEMKLDVIFEDEFLLAINKPAGIVVHPSANHQTNTLANGVKFYLNNSKKIRPINRLDRDTSGIVLFAKNEYIHEQMSKDKFISKEYIAITNGILEIKSGTINQPIARKPGSIMERCISEEGQEAITHYEVTSEIGNKYSVVKLILETGRTHQIRVHLAYLNAPILGDTLYGTSSELISRQALHAQKMQIIHPVTTEKLTLTANVPEDMMKILK